MLPEAFYSSILNVKIAAITVLTMRIKGAGDEDDEGGGSRSGDDDDDFSFTFFHHLSHMTECKSRPFHLDERISLFRELV